MHALRSLVLVAFLVTACGDDPDQGERVEGRQSGSESSTSEPAAAGLRVVEVFGGLSVELLVPPSVESGGELLTTMHVENRSGGPVTDPGCQLSNTRHALIPVDDPGAELWMVTMTDCDGPFTYEAGAVDDFAGPTFRASTKSGEPLPPGSYLAALEVAGKRLAYPVGITAP